jgi:hypothetical protein
MVKVAKIFLLSLLCSFAYAADGLTLYTDPDFPNFSFEYDPLVWSLEQEVFNPVVMSRNLKILAAKNQNGEEIIFAFSYPAENGYAEMCEVVLREGQADVVGEVAVRIYENYYQPRNYYAPQFNFTLCETDPRGCQERREQGEVTEFQPFQTDSEVIAVGCAIGLFETKPSREFLASRTFNSDVAYLENFGQLGYEDGNVWLAISVEPVGLESYQADTIISTMTY